MYGDLCALADVRKWLETTNTDYSTRDDLMLSRLITAASQFIQTWLAQNILTADYEELRDAVGGQTLVFGNSPVTAVLLVMINGLVIPPIPPLSQTPPGPVTVGFFGGPAGYLFTPTKLVIRGYRVPRLPLGVILQYTAGYSVVPSDIAQCCIELVVNRYRVERAHPGIVSTVMQPPTTVAYSQKDMNDFIKTTLGRYQPPAPVSTFSRILAPTLTDPGIVIAVI